MTEIVAVDVGGTHVRFAVVAIGHNTITHVSEPLVLHCAAFSGLEEAWRTFAAQAAAPLPANASIAVASPVQDGAFQLTNIDWVIDRERLRAALHLDRLALVNDMAAVGHAVAHLDASRFTRISGPDRPLAAARAISIVGPGTGVGVTLVTRRDATYDVHPCEGGHAGFAPADALDDTIAALARARHGRASAERVLSGPGIVLIRDAIARQEHRQAPPADDRTIWTAALNGDDPLAFAALTHWCTSLGRFAGDVALTHGADAVVIAGGLGQRLSGVLGDGAFARGFCDKGRFSATMQKTPVFLITHPQPGLFGAAAAFAQEFPE